MENKLIVSLSPHVHGGDSVQKNMYGVLIALIPAFLVSLYFFGLGALIVTATSVAACLFFEWAIGKYLMKKPTTTICDGSAIITGVLLAFNLPSNLPIWIIILGALFAIGVGKMSFGGLGCNPFNPALAGRVFLLLSFPVQMTTWPAVESQIVTPTPVVTYMDKAATDSTDAISGATPLALMKVVAKSDAEISKAEKELATLQEEALKPNADLTKIDKETTKLTQKIEAAKVTIEKAKTDMPSWIELLVGQNAGSLGEISGIALLLGLAYMLWRKIITWHIPLSIFATVFVFSGILHLANPQGYANPEMHLLTGGLLLGAIFMATDYVTSPITKTGQIVYGVCLGLLTGIFRLFGGSAEGVSYAIIISNLLVPLIEKITLPRPFGKGGER